MDKRLTPEQHLANAISNIKRRASIESEITRDNLPILTDRLIKMAESSADEKRIIEALETFVNGLRRLNDIRAETITEANVAIGHIREVIDSSYEVVEELADAGTIAMNLKVWMTTDPDFISRVLAMATPKARRAALAKLNLAIVDQWANDADDASAAAKHAGAMIKTDSSTEENDNDT